MCELRYPAMTSRASPPATGSQRPAARPTQSADSPTTRTGHTGRLYQLLHLEYALTETVAGSEVVEPVAGLDPDDARLDEPLLIRWMPAAVGRQEASYAASCTALKEFLTGVRVHLTARRAEQLAYPRLVALAG
ncbi:hypothetical protein ACFXGI_02995 [Streptomyces sp. NPDC059355]|uniref:hypothetical protein n=1 Tax=Streptomyces sp. NPDC059355 TaxID=3346811 RepID=UPI0036AA0863